MATRASDGCHVLCNDHQGEGGGGSSVLLSDAIPHGPNMHPPVLQSTVCLPWNNIFFAF